MLFDRFMGISDVFDQFMGCLMCPMLLFEDLICPISLYGILSVRCVQGHQTGCMQLGAICPDLLFPLSGRRTSPSDLSRSKIEAMEPSVKGILTDEKVGG